LKVNLSLPGVGGTDHSSPVRILPYIISLLYQWTFCRALQGGMKHTKKLSELTTSLWWMRS